MFGMWYMQFWVHGRKIESLACGLCSEDGNLNLVGGSVLFRNNAVRSVAYSATPSYLGAPLWIANTCNFITRTRSHKTWNLSQGMDWSPPVGAFSELEICWFMLGVTVRGLGVLP